ncbi:hypothetical protein D0Y65_026489 [Glycine soja]|uniref:Uncharacterized protein n=1 Tax=Glycine soja TaxID=3848 RepID=A0A445IK84_GLYSO|nr:hypothetical protein JHK87_027339 [Glycine soja]RZB86463.1 hypothetical protein D0Y65_026489 [Glycine soja]
MAWVLLDGEFCPKKFQFFRTSTFTALLQLLSGCRAIKRRDIYGAWEQYLGLEHDDSAPKKSYAVNQEINCCFVEWMCKLRCNINKRWMCNWRCNINKSFVLAELHIIHDHGS